jgi:hypothetical protein
MRYRIGFLTASIVVAAFGVGLSVAGDSLDRRLRAIARDGVNCGEWSEGGQNRGAVNSCVSKQLSSNRPFFARFGVSCEDSKCAVGVALEPAPGSLYVVHFDSQGCRGTKSSDPFCGTVLESCRRPKLTQAGNGLKLLCANEYQF